jgi:ribosomal protein L37AE/L43A
VGVRVGVEIGVRAGVRAGVQNRQIKKQEHITMPCPQCQSDKTVRKPKGPHIGEYCADCGRFYRWVPQGLENFIWPIGTKHKGKHILDILKEDRRYLTWAAETISPPGLRRKAQEALQSTIGPMTTPSNPGANNAFKKIVSSNPIVSTKHDSNLRPPNDTKLPWDD